MKTRYDFSRLGMESKKLFKGVYEITYKGYKFQVDKQWISNTWQYEQLQEVKENEYISGEENKLTDCKLAIMHQMDSIFEVKY